MADRLTIRSIETTPIRVPLARTYRGSSYRMTHRSTIVTRVSTEEGVVGEAYAGDEDADMLEIDHIIRQEIAPRLIGEDVLALAFDVRMAHHEEPQVASHLLASIPHGTLVECFHPDRGPI